MTDFNIDLDAYFSRIGYDGPRAPTLDLLKQIILLQQRAITFENLSSFAGVPVVIDPTTIENKIIRDGRGGYCHEQNQYLRLVLKALGYDARLRMARVRWMQPPEAMPQRGHMTLNVAVDGHWYLSDVAFGAMTPTAPLRLDTPEEQATPHQPYRVIPIGDSLHLEVKLGEHWRPVYSFDSVDYHPVDFEAANWQVSTFPASEFVRNLVVARPTGDRRQILNNTTLSIRHADGAVEKRTLASVEELRSTLTTMFGIALPADTKVDQALEGLFQTEGRS
ncbi:arylamine N-acetyltransferase [soil metagenome]